MSEEKQLEFPEINEMVVCRINKVLDYGVFVELLEYEGISGFVHISQVASSWVKNIRNFVKENQMRVAQVTRIDTSKKQVDLSFNKVQPRVQRVKIEEYKQLKRAQKLVEVMAKEKKESFDTAWEEIAEPLLDAHDSLHSAFREIMLKGEPAAVNVPKKWLPTLISVLSRSMEIAEKSVDGMLTLASPAPNGIEIIRNALIAAEKTKIPNSSVNITYSGSGKYRVKVTSPDYKTSEKGLVKVSEIAINEIKKGKGAGKFEKSARHN